jgi:hypothetical protein
VGRRIAQGWRLAKHSLTVARRDASLIGLSVLGLVATVLLAGVPFVGGALAFGGGQDVLGCALLVVTLFVAYFTVVFFGAAMVLAAVEVLDGKHATVGAALGGAVRQIGPIAGWAVVGTVLNLLFAVLRDRGGFARNTLASVGSDAWSLVTFLAVPVIALEGLGPTATLKRSAGLFRQRWGEQLTGTVSISLVFVLISLPAIVVVVLGIVVGGPGGVVLAAVGALAVLVILVLGRVASATFGAVLYRYAADGETSGSFSDVDLAGLARSKA